MNNPRISDLTELTQVSYNDYLPILDVSDTEQATTGSTRKVAFYHISPVTILLRATGSNDHTLIQAALDQINSLGGGTLKLLKGTYDMAGGIRLYNNTTLWGEGAGVTILKANGSWTSGDAISLGNPEPGFNSASLEEPDTYSNIHIKDIEFDANGKSHAGIAFWAVKNVCLERYYVHGGVGSSAGPYGVYFVNCTNVYLDHSEIGNLFGRDSIQFKGVVNGNVYKCNIHDNSDGFNAVDSHASDGTYTRNGKKIHIENNEVDACDIGFSVQESNSVVTGNTISNFKSIGIEVQGNPLNVSVMKNIVDQNTGTGQGILIITGTTASGIKVDNNTVSNVNGSATADGILLQSSGAIDVSCNGNTVRNCGRRGIYVRTSGYTVCNNNIYDDQAVATQAEGITLETNVTNCIVNGNKIKNNTQAQIRCVSGNSNNQFTNNQLVGGLRGMLFNGSANNLNNLIASNHFENNSTAPITSTGGSIGTGTKVRNNDGYTTEASGTDTIASGTTSKVITHGLSVTPTLKDIGITLGENPTNTAGDVYVTSITSTQFTVNVRNDPGASNLDFGWRAIVL